MSREITGLNGREWDFTGRERYFTGENGTSRERTGFYGENGNSRDITGENGIPRERTEFHGKGKGFHGK